MAATGVVFVVVKGGDTVVHVFTDLREAWACEKQQRADTDDSVEVRTAPFN